MHFRESLTSLQSTSKPANILREPSSWTQTIPVQFEQKLIPGHSLSPALQNPFGCIAFVSPSQQTEARRQTTDNVPWHTEVLLAKETLIFGSDPQTIAPPAQLQQPVQQQLAKPLPTKLFQRGGSAGGAQGSAHKMFTLATSLGTVPACRNVSPRMH